MHRHGLGYRHCYGSQGCGCSDGSSCDPPWNCCFINSCCCTSAKHDYSWRFWCLCWSIQGLKWCMVLLLMPHVMLCLLASVGELFSLWSGVGSGIGRWIICQLLALVYMVIFFPSCMWYLFLCLLRKCASYEEFFSLFWAFWKCFHYER